jgi:hypothetical protein
MSRPAQDVAMYRIVANTGSEFCVRYVEWVVGCVLLDMGNAIVLPLVKATCMGIFSSCIGSFLAIR